MPWDDMVLHDWTHYSGEFGERVYHVRRVKLDTTYRDQAPYIQGLIRVEWFNPDDSGTSFEWEYYKEVGD